MYKKTIDKIILNLNHIELTKLINTNKKFKSPNFQIYFDYFEITEIQI